MSSASAPIANSNSSSSSSSSSSPIDHSRSRSLHHKCCMKNVRNINGCTRKVVWLIDGIGEMCNYCWTIYFQSHWRDIDVDRIHRLSEEEEDFYVRPALDRKHYGHPRRKGEQAGGE